MFYNEFDILNARLKYLYDTVDYFVLVEATKTLSGNAKPLYFNDNRSRFQAYLDKIVHVVVDDMPIGTLWTRKRIDFHTLRENHQRNCIDRGIQRLQLNDDDIILISDIDEIPNRDVLHTTLPADICGLSQDFYYYNFTCKNKSKWTCARVLTHKAYVLIRNCQYIRAMHAPVIENGGWHLSYFGNAEFIANKIRSFGHQEYNVRVFTDLSNIQDKIDKGIDVFGRQNEVWMHVTDKCPIADYF